MYERTLNVQFDKVVQEISSCSFIQCVSCIPFLLFYKTTTLYLDVVGSSFKKLHHIVIVRYAPCILSCSSSLDRPLGQPASSFSQNVTRSVIGGRDALVCVIDILHCLTELSRYTFRRHTKYKCQRIAAGTRSFVIQGVCVCPRQTCIPALLFLYAF